MPLPHPFPSQKAVDLGFLDARSKLLDLAAFLDRVERAGEDSDYRVEALYSALSELSGPTPDRARRILERLSDPSLEPIERATVKSATGVPSPR